MHGRGIKGCTRQKLPKSNRIESIQDINRQVCDCSYFEGTHLDKIMFYNLSLYILLLLHSTYHPL